MSTSHTKRPKRRPLPVPRSGWGIIDYSESEPDWLRDRDTGGILVFPSAAAAKWAAEEQGYGGCNTFAEARRNGWCDVQRIY